MCPKKLHPMGSDVRHDARLLHRAHRAIPLLAGFLALGTGHSPQTLEPSLESLLAKAAAYEQRFEQEFQTIVGHERYEQRRSGFGLEFDTERRRQRIIESDTLFVRLPEEQSWLTARNVRRVDDLVVLDSETRLERLLADTTEDWVARVRRLRDEGARFNLGKIQRNFSDPTMVMQFLSLITQPRFRFERRGREQVSGREAWRLSYNELRRPTLIQSNGQDVPATGDVWIDAIDGAVLRTRVTLRDVQRAVRLIAMIDVTYQREPNSAIWVPARMQETYENGGRTLYHGESTSFNERVDCLAIYSNFRRFQTDARIVRP